MLLIENISKSYGGHLAVRSASFSVDGGEMLALIGPNGAGKSTCFNMVGGQIRPDTGSIRLNGKEIGGLPTRAVWRLGVGRTFQISATFGSMTVLENVQMALISAARQQCDALAPVEGRHQNRAMAVLERVGIADQADRSCGVLAYGDLKRVELAIALSHAPQLLLMDEPTAGMAPLERTTLMQLVADIVREQRIAVLFTEHDMDVVFTHATRIAVLDRGQIIAAGTPDAVRADPEVKRIYLGGQMTAPPEREAATGGAPVLSVAGMNAGYGRAQILYDTGLTLRAGEVVALLGRNGAGKSTTMKAIMGLLPGTTGARSFAGVSLDGLQPYRISHLGLAYVPEERRVFAALTILENLEVGRNPGVSAPHPWTLERIFALFPNLGERRHALGGRLSGGEQQMLAIARALMGNPTAILLDEPSEGIAPVIVEQMAQAVLRLKQEGLAILLSEQNLHFARAVCDRAYVLEKGVIRFDGTMRELLADAAIAKAYLAV
jgi:branched-chain amino acid transport system ATP-binding protein